MSLLDAPPPVKDYAHGASYPHNTGLGKREYMVIHTDGGHIQYTESRDYGQTEAARVSGIFVEREERSFSQRRGKSFLVPDLPWRKEQKDDAQPSSL